MKKLVLRFISAILVFTLTIFNIPISSVFASNSLSSLEAIKEAMEDASSKNPAGDWGTAIFKDGLDWGYFHRKVQEHIVSTNKELWDEIGSEFPIIFKNGKKGRADISVQVGDLTYLWEVKPLSYAFPPKLFSAAQQLSSYVNSNSTYRYGNTDGINIPSDSFILGNYRVSYNCVNNGLIFYWFERTAPIPQRDPALVAEKEKERAKELNLEVRKLVINGVAYENIADLVRQTQSAIKKADEIKELEEIREELVELDKDTCLIPKKTADRVFLLACEIAAIELGKNTLKKVLKEMTDNYNSTEEYVNILTLASCIAEDSCKQCITSLRFKVIVKQTDLGRVWHRKDLLTISSEIKNRSSFLRSVVRYSILDIKIADSASI